MMTEAQIRESIEFYFKIKKPIHIKTRGHNLKFFRGIVIKPFDEKGKMLLNEELYGEIIVWIEQIDYVEMRIPKTIKKRGDGDEGI